MTLTIKTSCQIQIWNFIQKWVWILKQFLTVAYKTGTYTIISKRYLNCVLTLSRSLCLFLFLPVFDGIVSVGISYHANGRNGSRYITILFLWLSTYASTRTARYVSVCLSAREPRRRSKRCTNFTCGDDGGGERKSTREIRQKGK